jgi:outer membrane protein OmpA-like peptidoglycan-associated protein
VLAITDGTCVFTIAIAADAIYGGASTTVTINVNTPSSTSAPGAGTGGGSLPSDSPVTQDNQIPVPISPAVVAAPNSAESNASLATTNIKRRQLPPPPSNISIRRIAISGKAKVAVDLPTGAAGDAVAATVVVVRDVTGRVVARISVEIARGQDAVVITVPFASAGYTVSVYNVNDVGVSTGALVSSPVVQAKTISSRDVNDRPLLFGNQLGKPVIFNGGSVALDAVDRSKLNRIAQQATRSNGRLFVTGFARKGGGSANELDRLSSLRAQTVATYLSSRGVRVWIRYWGAGSLDGTGQPADRRVEVRQSADAVPRTFVS